jgi:transcriptional regulator with XRE-family HTH domain
MEYDTGIMPVVKLLGDGFYRELGRKLKEVRVQAGLRQEAVSVAIGFKPKSGQSYVSRLEKGSIRCVKLDTIVGYLRACKAPIGKSMLELAQSGAFGEVEQGLTVVEDKANAEQAKRAKAKLLYEKRWLREAQDADIVAKVWTEVQAAIQPLLAHEDPTRRLMVPYLQGVRSFYRAWKQAVHGVLNRDPVLDVQMAFDRVEQAGLEARLVPAAVHKMREIVFDRLMELMPQGGKL